MKILVKGDHPCFVGRPDRVFNDPELAREYYNELFKAGYENIEMNILKEGNHDRFNA